MPQDSVLNLEGLEYFRDKSKDELSKKVDKVSGKGLSTNDYTTAEKNKLAGIATGANKTTVDSVLSSTSTNPVQNKVVNTALNGKANSSHKHNSADINSLDAAKLTGTIDIARLPQGALDRLVKVADDTARFKLTTKDVQLGDTVQTLDNKKMYYVVDESKLSSADGYAPYTADTATSVPWSGVTGKPSSYTPSSHTHDDRYYTETEINTKLAGKSDTGHTHTKSQITDFPTSMAANGGNSSTVNGHTVNSDVPANAKFTDTWRGIQNNLTSDSTTDSLSAAQGKALKTLVDTKTSNTGTLTGIKMNGASKGTSGVVDLGTVLTGGKQTTTSTVDGGSNVYTFSDGSTITVKNGSKGSTGATGSPGAAGKNGSNGTSAIWFTGTAVTGTATSATAFTVSGSKAGDMYLNTSTYNVYRASATNSWIYVCNIKGTKGADGKNGTNGTNATTTATGTSSTAGLTKLYTGTGTATDGTMTQNAIKSALDGKANSSHTHSNMTAATASAAGKAGFVPAPAAGKQGQYLRGDGTWATPTNTTYSAATQSANGLMSAADKKKLDGIASGATAGSGKVVYQSKEPTGQAINDSWLQAY